MPGEEEAAPGQPAGLYLVALALCAWSWWQCSYLTCHISCPSVACGHGAGQGEFAQQSWLGWSLCSLRIR